ncbi:MAG: HAD family phosphatase [Verrucomicrobia bacterium]|nr:HAD family phosphatase [Verrucomicrobiota bacterium]
MKKFLFSLVFASTSLIASPKAVIFDWGNVIASPDRDMIANFLCDCLHISKSEFESVNLEKRKAVSAGQPEIGFWLEYAQAKGIELPQDWPEQYNQTLRASINADQKIYSLIDTLKKNGLRVGLLSNINDRHKQMIEDFGFYEPFEPCLLSCEMGLEKPDPRVFELLLSSLDLPAHEVVFIDDKIDNVEAAKQLGIDAIHFQSEPQLKDELLKRISLK